MDEQRTGGSAASGYSRRDVLKRGAVAGGTLVWAVPAIQLISMTSAQAESPSAPPSSSQPSAPGATPAGTNPLAPEASDASLAYTGFPVAPVVAGGAGLVAAGLAAGAVARKRGAADTAGEPGAAPA